MKKFDGMKRKFYRLFNKERDDFSLWAGDYEKSFTNLSVQVHNMMVEVKIEELKNIKIKPHSHQISCPDGCVGCLVLHYSKDLILTPQERQHNDRINKRIAELQIMKVKL